VGNLLNSNWGVNKTTSGSGNGRILTYGGRDESNVPQFSMAKVRVDGNDVYPVKTFSPLLDYGQCWRLQVGLRYIFN
jgi:hypothetical protein